MFHAGTKFFGEDVVTDGGRVLAVTSYAPTLPEALKSVYAGVDQVFFEGKTYRRDIAHRYISLPTEATFTHIYTIGLLQQQMEMEKQG